MAVWSSIVSSTAKGASIYARAMSDGLDQFAMAKGLLAHSRLQIKTVFEALAQEDGRPTLIHGRGTSLVICLALLLLDVPTNAIEYEYRLTEQYLDTLCRLTNERRREAGLDDLTDSAFDRSYTDKLCKHVYMKYHGVETYLMSIGVTPDQLERIKNNLQRSTSQDGKLVDLD